MFITTFQFWVGHTISYIFLLWTHFQQNLNKTECFPIASPTLHASLPPYTSNAFHKKPVPLYSRDPLQRPTPIKNELKRDLQHRPIPGTDLKFSEIGLGTDHMGGNHLIDDKDALEQLEVATQDYGINWIDLAEYAPIPFSNRTWGLGHENILKPFLKLRRSQVYISVRIEGRQKGIQNNINGKVQSTKLNLLCTTQAEFRNRIHNSVKNILQRLNIDYIDLLQLDFPERYVPRSHLGEDTYCHGLEDPSTLSIESQVECFEELVQRGHVRYIGLSNETPYGAFRWKSCNETSPKADVKSIQLCYNLLHRNELESAGFSELVHPKNLNLPILAYGSLAGGILTGKYLDPERFNVFGPDQRLNQHELDHELSTHRGSVPEDWGYLSYGPKVGKCNRFPYLYHTHRSVWSQWKLTELLKLARQYGLSLTQLSLAWIYSRPFITSTIIGPRTLGQLRNSIRVLNYPWPNTIENDIHAIYLRYRAPTMGGPQVLSSLENQIPISQHDYIKYSRGPIWSGGTFWPHHHRPNLQKQLKWIEKHDDTDHWLAASGSYDDPSDKGLESIRIWKERTDEGLPGEFFAVKESKLFGWDEKQFKNWNWEALDETEKQKQNTDDFHILWKDGKISKTKTTPAMESFYKNFTSIYHVVWPKIKAYQKRIEEGVRFPPFNRVDFDLVEKKLQEKHNLTLYDRDIIRQIYLHRINLTDPEKQSEPFWLWRTFAIDSAQTP